MFPKNQLKTYTFYIKWKSPHEMFEEIDVQATNRRKAREEAVKVLARDYHPEWRIVRIIEQGGTFF